MPDGIPALRVPEWAVEYDRVRRTAEEGAVKNARLAELASIGRITGQNFPWRMNNGQTLMIAPSECMPFMTVGWTCFTTGQWEPNIERILAPLLRPNSHAIDVGANLGYFTAAMAARVPAGRVYAFEPHPSTFERLSAACELNAHDNTSLFRCALGSTPGCAQLWAHDSATGNASLVRDAIARLARPVQVELMTLDALFERGAIDRVDLMKVDVEGHELEVLRGGEQLLRQCAPHLIIELNERMSRLAGWGPCDLDRVLRSIGAYDVYRIDDDRITRVRLTNVAVSRNTHVDLLALASARPRPVIPGIKEPEQS